MSANLKVVLIVFALLLIAGVCCLNIVWPGKPTSATFCIDAKWEQPTTMPVPAPQRSSTDTQGLQEKLLKGLDDLSRLQAALKEAPPPAPASQPVVRSEPPTSKPVETQPITKPKPVETQPASKPILTPTDKPTALKPTSRPIKPTEIIPAAPTQPATRPATPLATRPAPVSQPTVAKPVERPLVEPIGKKKGLSFPEYDKQMTQITSKAMVDKDFKKAVRDMVDLSVKYSGLSFDNLRAEYTETESDKDEDIAFRFWKSELKKYVDSHPGYESAVSKGVKR